MGNKNKKNPTPEFEVGYTGEYFWDHYQKRSATFWQIPATIAVKLSNSYLPEHLQSRTLLLENKRFVVVGSTDEFAVVIEKHDSSLSLILIDRLGNFPVDQWRSILDIPKETAEYWLRTPAAELLSHDRADQFSTLTDERSVVFNLLNRESGLRLVAGNRFVRHQLALRRENEKYALYALKAYA